MKKITYRKLMAIVEAGDAQINAWTNDGEPQLADVTFFKSNGTSKREHVEVTKVPEELK